MLQDQLDKIKAKHPNHEVELRENGTIKMSLKCEEPSLTQQEFKEEVNINSIMKKYHGDKIITHLMSGDAMFDDVSNIPDYKTALNIQIQAEDSFMQLPAKVRQKFRNNPAELMDFLNDSKNYDEAVELGLVKKKEAAISPEPQNPPVSDSSKESEAAPKQA